MKEINDSGEMLIEIFGEVDAELLNNEQILQYFSEVRQTESFSEEPKFSLQGICLVNIETGWIKEISYEMNLKIGKEIEKYSCYSWKKIEN